MPEDPKLPMRTDDVAHRIEYATGSQWTPAQYRLVMGILRDYRHYSIMTILDKAASSEEESGALEK